MPAAVAVRPLIVAVLLRPAVPAGPRSAGAVLLRSAVAIGPLLVVAIGPGPAVAVGPGPVAVGLLLVVTVGPRSAGAVLLWSAVVIGPLLAVAVGPLLVVAVGPRWAADVVLWSAVVVGPRLVVAVGPGPVAVGSLLAVAVGPLAAAAGPTRPTGYPRPAGVAGPAGRFVASVVLVAVAPGVPGLRRLVAFGFHHLVVGSRRCSRICAADGFVSAVPFGRTTVGTVWLPPLTDITYSAESGSRSMSTSVTSIPSRASWLFNRRQ